MAIASIDYVRSAALDIVAVPRLTQARLPSFMHRSAAEDLVTLSFEHCAMLWATTTWHQNLPSAIHMASPVLAGTPVACHQIMREVDLNMRMMQSPSSNWWAPRQCEGHYA